MINATLKKGKDQNCCVLDNKHHRDLSVSAQFRKESPYAPILYQAWLTSLEMEKVVTPDRISVLGSELQFVELSDVLWTITV